MRLLLLLGAVASAALLAAPPAADSPWKVELVDVALRAGLRDTAVYGGLDRKRFIIETNGSGVALRRRRQRRLARRSRTQRNATEGRDANGRRFLVRRRAHEPPVPESPQRPLRGCHRPGRTSEDRLGIWCVRGRLRQRRLDRSVRDLLRVECPLSQPWRRPVRRCHQPSRIGRQGRTMGLGCTFVDIDRDGRLDLFVANYLRFDLQTAPEPGSGVNARGKASPSTAVQKDCRRIRIFSITPTVRAGSATSRSAPGSRGSPGGTHDSSRRRPNRRRMAGHLRRIRFDGGDSLSQRATAAGAHSPTTAD
jgi:enediyne biosynthesis protein E4